MRVNAEQFEIRVSYEFTAEDFLEVFRVGRPVWEGLLVGWGPLMIGALFVGASAYVLAERHNYVAFSIFLLIGASSAYHGLSVLGWITFRQSQVQPELRGKRYVEILNRSVIFDSSAKRVEIGWAAFSGFQETKRLLILCLSGKEVRIVPKRAFNQTDLGTTIQFLRGKLAPCTCPNKPHVLLELAPVPDSGLPALGPPSA